MRSISHLVIHCSASPNGGRTTAADIDAWHKQRGFKRAPEALARQQAHLRHIGYHFVIDTTGIVTNGRHVEEIGAHVQGSNARSIGICQVGTDKFTAPQWKTLGELIARLQREYPTAKVCGHRDFSPDLDGDGVIERHEWIKICPGFDVGLWLSNGMRPLPENIL
jgi:N-acetyl-anhydromuramyl-L-alanine amidase AmpD